YPDGFDIRNSAGKLGPGLDVRGNQGYIVAPPLRHLSGQRYAWDAAAHPDDIPLAPAPGWMLALLLAPTNANIANPEKGRAGAPVVAAKLAEGSRNATLTSLAGTMRRRGMSEEAIAAALLAENEARCDPPLAEAEVLKIAKSVARYAPE